MQLYIENLIRNSKIKNESEKGKKLRKESKEGRKERKEERKEISK